MRSDLYINPHKGQRQVAVMNVNAIILKKTRDGKTNNNNIQSQVIHQNPFFTYITKKSFLVNNTLSAAGTRDKHNYLNIKAYPKLQKGAAQASGKSRSPISLILGKYSANKM